MRATGSRITASFLAAQVALAAMTIHCVRKLNFDSNQVNFIVICRRMSCLAL
jgi:hypothetical protein